MDARSLGSHPGVWRTRTLAFPASTARRSTLVNIALILVLAAALLLVFGLPSLGNDSRNALVWGRDLLDGVKPAYDEGPTPHPLTNAIAGLASLAGVETSITLMALFGALTLAALIVAVGRLGQELWSPAVGI